MADCWKNLHRTSQLNTPSTTLKGTKNNTLSSMTISKERDVSSYPVSLARPNLPLRPQVTTSLISGFCSSERGLQAWALQNNYWASSLYTVFPPKKPDQESGSPTHRVSFTMPADPLQNTRSYSLVTITKDPPWKISSTLFDTSNRPPCLAWVLLGCVFTFEFVLSCW